MELREYFFRKEISLKDFCLQIEYWPTYVGAISRGHRKCGKRLAKIIVSATNGEVTLSDIDAPYLRKHPSE